MRNARLIWLPPNAGGRSSLPKGARYTAVARFAGQDDLSWRKEAWSLVVEFTDPPSPAHPVSVRVGYLTDGPATFLESGKSFELMEGDRVVARGEFE